VQSKRDETVPIPLSRRPCGIEMFRVEGCLDSEAVHAHWDGRWVTASKLLYERVALAMAIDEVFAEAEVAPALGEHLRRSPEEFMLALLTCCDEIDLAEYEVRGYRRVIAPDV
jgi:hypothetical protein